MSLPRLEKAAPLGSHRLRLRWNDGRHGVADLGGMIARLAVLEPLEDPKVFRRAEIADWGATIAWPGVPDATLSSLTLRRLADEQAGFAAKNFIAWQAAHGLSNQEAADVLGLALRTIKNYRAGRAIPRAVAAACRAMDADPVVLMAHFRPRPPRSPRGRAKAA